MNSTFRALRVSGLALRNTPKRNFSSGGNKNINDIRKKFYSDPRVGEWFYWHVNTCNFVLILNELGMDNPTFLKHGTKDSVKMAVAVVWTAFTLVSTVGGGLYRMMTGTMVK